MYQLQFFATTSADWAAAIELIDNETNLALGDLDDAVFELDVEDSDGDSILNAGTDDEDGIIEVVEGNIVQWRFPKEQIGRCKRGHTYTVGMTLTNALGTTQLFTGTLAIIDGVVR